MTAVHSTNHDRPGDRSTRLDQVLQDLLIQAPQVQAAAVVSFDGLPMASALPAGMDEDRVAAMSAALLSLGERAAMGLGRGELSQVYVEGDNGTVFLVSADDEAVLVAVAAKGAKVGLMLFEAKQAAGAVADALRAEDAVAEAQAAPLTEHVQPVPDQNASVAAGDAAPQSEVQVDHPAAQEPELIEAAVTDPAPTTAVHVPLAESTVYADPTQLPPPAPADLVVDAAQVSAPTAPSQGWSSSNGWA
jgi:predicted regulator of Ras-like GTPase activity (Roadblock/LC7/MglB family)